MYFQVTATRPSAVLQNTSAWRLHQVILTSTSMHTSICTKLEDLGLLGYSAVSIGKWFLLFQWVVVSTSSMFERSKNLLTDFMDPLNFEHKGNMLFQNVRNHSPNNTAHIPDSWILSNSRVRVKYLPYKRSVEKYCTWNWNPDWKRNSALYETDVNISDYITTNVNELLV